MGTEVIFTCDRCSSRSDGRKDGWWDLVDDGYKLTVERALDEPVGFGGKRRLCGARCAVEEVADWLRARSGGSTPASP